MKIFIYGVDNKMFEIFVIYEMENGICQYSFSIGDYIRCIPDSSTTDLKLTEENLLKFLNDERFSTCGSSCCSFKTAEDAIRYYFERS